MIVKLRQFNDRGIECFDEMLKKLKENPFAETDQKLLEDREFTEEVPGEGYVTQQKFTTKGEAGEHLYTLLDSLPRHKVEKNVGLWSWLSLFFFDSVCPKDKEGGWLVRKGYTYILDPQPKRDYQHLLFVSWRAWSIATSRNQHHRLIMDTPVNTLDTVTREVMKNPSLIRIPCIFEVLDCVYWNTKTNKARKNITSETREGNISKRFPDVIRQLEVTYDLQSLNAKQLIELLGDEFDFSTR